jgi:hypothetical protein
VAVKAVNPEAGLAQEEREDLQAQDRVVFVNVRSAGQEQYTNLQHLVLI